MVDSTIRNNTSAGDTLSPVFAFGLNVLQAVFTRTTIENHTTTGGSGIFTAAGAGVCITKLTDTKVLNNVVTGEFAEPPLTVSANSGGTVTIERSLFSGNTTPFAPQIAIGGAGVALNMSESVVISPGAQFTRAIDINGMNHSGTIQNSTIIETGSTDGEGVWLDGTGSALTLRHVTISGFDRSVVTPNGAIQIANSVVGPSVGTGKNFGVGQFSPASITSLGGNVLAEVAGEFTLLASDTEADPGILPVVDDGTHLPYAPLTGPLGIDTAVAAEATAIDQRGFPRPMNGGTADAPDAGAIEVPCAGPDGDGDGVPDACDSCPLDPENDADMDGHCAEVDLCPGQNDMEDKDGDGVPNGCDPFYTLVVNTTADEALTGNCWTRTGSCSLRTAVIDSNGQDGGENFEILVPAGTFELTLTGTGAQGGDLDLLWSNTTIRGQGIGQTIVVASSDRAFSFSRFVDVALYDLSIARGAGTTTDANCPGGGSAICSGCNLEMRRVRITGGQDSVAAVVLASGTVAMHDVALENNLGDGLRVEASAGAMTLSLHRGLIANHTGTGISLAPLATSQVVQASLRNVTISGNTQGSTPDGISAGGLRVGVGSTAALEHCTITNNSSSAGGAGGLAVLPGGHTSLRNTLLANNTGAKGDAWTASSAELDAAYLGALPANASLTTAVMTSGGGNAVGPSPSLALVPNASDLAAGSIVTTGPLADNGGLFVSHLPTSANLIDSGVTTLLLVDARYVGRVLDGNDDGSLAPDIGAIEVIPAAP